MRPKVSIIVLNYNGLEYSRNCLKSLLGTRYKNFRIYLIDNGSEINEAKILKKEFKNKKIHFTRFPQNLGFVEGTNQAVKNISSKYIVFLNNDTLVKPDWLLPMVKEMESDKNIGACQPKILSLNASVFDYAGASGGFLDKYGYPFTRGRIFFSSEKDKGQYDQKTEIFWASGVALMTRKEYFIKSGMFDPIYFLYMEEIDFCWRLKNLGFKIFVIPSSTVYHKTAATAGRNMIKKRFYEHRNNLLLLAKNYTLRDLVVLFPERMLLEYISFIYFLIKFDWESFFGQMWAHCSFWILLPKVLLKKRKRLKQVKYFAPQIYQKSVVFQYFIFKKRNFETIINSK